MLMFSQVLKCLVWALKILWSFLMFWHKKTIPVSTLNVPRQEDIDSWPYLKEVKLHDIHANVDLLVGTDAPKVLGPLEVVNSQKEGPYAVRTRVGWVINGPLHGGSCRGKSGYSAVTANRISVEHLQNACKTVITMTLMRNHEKSRLKCPEKTSNSWISSVAQQNPYIYIVSTKNAIKHCF